MQVTSGAKPNGKYIEVTLTEDDFKDRDNWDSVGVMQKWQIMTRYADGLLVEYMLRNGDISQDYADQRLREIRGE